MKRLSIVLTLASLTLALNPGNLIAGWIRTYSNDDIDVGESVVVADDGGYVIVGGTSALLHNESMLLIKTDAEGDSVWMHVSDSLDGSCIQKTSVGGYIISGTKRTWDWDYPRLTKVDSNGEIQWSHFYPHGISHQAKFVQRTSDGGYVITAGYWSLLKTDSLGDTLWNSFIEIHEDTLFYSYCVQQTSDGGYILTGKTWFDENLWVVRTDHNGDTLWTRTYGEGEGYRIQPTNDGSFIILQEEGPRLLKINADGTTLWDTTYDMGVGRSIQPLTDGGYTVTGATSDEHNRELMLFKTSSEGEVLWTKFYKVNEGCQGECVKQTADGGLIIAGYSFVSYDDDWDLLLIKTDANGEVGLSEQPVADAPGFEVISPVGRRITLRYSDFPYGFNADIFDASGRKIDELRSSTPSGTITWPVTPVILFSPGVYFIRPLSGNPVQKVVLIK